MACAGLFLGWSAVGPHRTPLDTKVVELTYDWRSVCCCPARGEDLHVVGGWAAVSQGPLNTAAQRYPAGRAPAAAAYTGIGRDPVGGIEKEPVKKVDILRPTKYQRRILSVCLQIAAGLWIRIRKRNANAGPGGKIWRKNKIMHENC